MNVISFRLSDDLERKLKEYQASLNDIGGDVSISDLIRHGIELAIQEHEDINRGVVTIQFPKSVTSSQELKDIWEILSDMEKTAIMIGFETAQDFDALRMLQRSRNKLIPDIESLQSTELTGELIDLINTLKK